MLRDAQFKVEALAPKCDEREECSRNLRPTPKLLVGVVTSEGGDVCAKSAPQAQTIPGLAAINNAPFAGYSLSRGAEIRTRDL